MAEIVKLLDPENYRRVAERIKKLWKEGTVEWALHSTERMKECGIDQFDVENVIRTGRITSHSKPGDNWRYVLDGNGIDERSIRVVVEIDGLLLVITVFERT